MTFGRRRRRRRPVAAGLLAVVATVAWLGAGGGAAGEAAGAAGEAAGATGGPARASHVDVTAAPGTVDAATPRLARLGALTVHLPAPSPLVVGFHEAATTTAFDVTPVGVVREDRNTTRTDLAPDVPGGTPYLVLSSRGRAAGPTSAVDVVLPEGDTVLAPVTGTVVDVRDYLLYGAHEDLRIELVPDARPDLRLVVIHVAGGRVAVGDRVVAGVTPIAASARRFPFSSHIDRETEPERHPHVHLELQPVDAARPGGAADEERDEEPVPGPAGPGDLPATATSTG